MRERVNEQQKDIMENIIVYFHNILFVFKEEQSLSPVVGNGWMNENKSGAPIRL